MSNYRKIRDAKEFNTRAVMRHIKEKSRQRSSARDAFKDDLERQADAILRAIPKDMKKRKKSSVGYAPNPNSRKSFYASWEWRKLRMLTLKKYGHRCQSCGATTKDIGMHGHPVRLVVDHIKPLGRHWDLRLHPDNLQVLCDECNMGKGDWDETDYRP